MLLTIMWKKGSPESESTRLLKAGLADLSLWSGAHKTSCRAYVRALISKLAIEEVETFDAAAGKEGARVYRIYSFPAILERRRRANLTHVIRTGATVFVDPATGAKLLPDSNLLPDRDLPVPAAAVVLSAIREVLGHSDPIAAGNLTRACRAQASDATEDEIARFIRLHAGRIRSLSPGDDPVSLLLRLVPKCFEGPAFQQFREAERRRREVEALLISTTSNP